MWMIVVGGLVLFFYLNDPATTEIYTYGHTLSLHDALPIWRRGRRAPARARTGRCRRHRRRRARSTWRCAKGRCPSARRRPRRSSRSEEHTSELQSLMRISYAVFCLKKKKATTVPKETPLIHTRNKQRPTNHCPRVPC